MMRELTSLRTFKGGAWDLRKSDRRREVRMIGFPERRAEDRRQTANALEYFGADKLQWVTKSDLDE